MNRKQFLNRFIIIIIIAAVFCASVMTSAAAVGISATPTSSTVTVDNKDVTFEAYNIDGNNYFKLRDLAMALNYTSKKFQVEWLNGAIQLYTYSHYIAVGGELSVSGNKGTVTAIQTASSVYIDGSLIDLKAYNIGGYNYFKLRDVAAALDFGVIWIESPETIRIDTTVSYTDDSDSSGTTDDYFMKSIVLALPGAMPDSTYSYIYYTISATDIITVTKNSDKNYDIQLTYTAGNKNADLALLSKAIGVFVSTPNTVIATLNGLNLQQSSDLYLDGKYLHCYNNGGLGVKVAW
jgi:hypothetical protein